jgi:hypothetical protein
MPEKPIDISEPRDDIRGVAINELMFDVLLSAEFDPSCRETFRVVVDRQANSSVSPIVGHRFRPKESVLPIRAMRHSGALLAAMMNTCSRS